MSFRTSWILECCQYCQDVHNPHCNILPIKGMIFKYIINVCTGRFYRSFHLWLVKCLSIWHLTPLEHLEDQANLLSNRPVRWSKNRQQKLQPTDGKRKHKQKGKWRGRLYYMTYWPHLPSRRLKPCTLYSWMPSKRHELLIQSVILYFISVIHQHHAFGLWGCKYEEPFHQSRDTTKPRRIL